MVPPSVARALVRARHTAARFPLALLSAFVVFVAVAFAIEGPDPPWLLRLWLVAGLGLSLFTAQVTAAERYRLSPVARWVGAGLLVLVVVALFATSWGWTTALTGLRFAQLALASHLLVAVGPYLVGGNRAGFWQYNRHLFLRYLVAAFYAFVLWTGLAIALAAIDKLLGVHVRSEWYAHLAAFLAFGFHPWFFLAGVPEDYEALDQAADYPLGLKVFTQFVLLPLVVVYLSILTLYLGRVVVTRSWPSGWIGYLVSSVSAAGVLALLLLHPLRERADSKWVNGYGRWFFAAILPSLGMLLVATAKRVQQYGITERRYFLLMLALWMLGVALYYAVTASRNIRIIPTSLALVALVTWFGPWGAYQVSYRSQRGRLDRLLSANQMGSIGAVRQPDRAVSFADRKEMSGVLDYLEETRGSAAVAGAIGVPETALAWQRSDTVLGSSQLSWRAMRRIGLGYVGRWQTDSTGPNLDRSIWIQQVTAAVEPSEDIRGFEALKYFGVGDSIWVIRLPDSVTVRATWKSPRLRIFGPDRPAEEIDLNPEFLKLAAGTEARSGGIARPIVIDRETEQFKIRLIWTQLSARIARDTAWLQAGTGAMLVGRRRQP